MMLRYFYRIIFTFVLFYHHLPHVTAYDHYTGYTLQDSIEIYRLSGAYDFVFKKTDELLPLGNSSTAPMLKILEKAEIFRLKKNYDASKSFLDSAKNLLNKLPEEYALNARLLLYQGRWLKSMNSSQNSQLSDSILSCYSAAYNLIDDTEGSIWLKSAISYEAGRYLHRTLGEMKEAKIWYERLVNLATQAPDVTDYRRGYYLFYASVYYNENGDYERSILLAKIALYIMKNGPFPNDDMYMYCLQIFTNSNYDSENYEEAIKGYENIIDFASTAYGENDPQLIVHYVNISQPLIITGKYEKAISYCGRAKKLINSSKVHQEYLPWLYNNLAEASEGLGLHEAAKSYFNMSIRDRIKNSGLYSQNVYEGFRYFGEYYERNGDYRTALDYYQKSISSIFEKFEPKDIYDNPDFSTYSNTESLLYVLFDKAGTCMKYWKQTNDNSFLECANDLYKVIYIRLDELLNSGFLDKSSMQIYHRFEEGLDKSITCSVALYEITKDQKYLEQAWQYMEKNKYFLLYKALVNANTTGPNKDKKLARQIDEISMNLQKAVNEDTVFHLSNRLLNYLNEKNRDALPDHESTINISGDSTLVTLENVRALASDKGDILAEFHWSAEFIYTFLMHEGRAGVIRRENTPKLHAAIRDYAGTISRYSTNNRDFIAFTKAAYTLYQELVQPIEERIRDERGSTSRIIIIPDGPLATLPFEAFIMTPDTISNNYWGLDYLCRKYIVNYAYSLSILQKNLEKSQSVQHPGILALSYSSQLDKNADVELQRSENELPYSAEEILRIKKIMAAKCFLGNEATETQFKASASQFSLIHLALHGKADTTDMFNSRLIFKHDPSEKEDGELHAFELYDLDLSKLQLAVLSACETGLGEVHKGEGIFSIARGFAYAGCPSMVMSLWKVNDKTTADLVDYFYKNLRQGLPKDEALRNAKLDYLKSADDLSAHPANWAAFVALGNNTPVQLPKKQFPWLVVVVGLAVVRGGFFVFRKYSSNI